MQYFLLLLVLAALPVFAPVQNVRSSPKIRKPANRISVTGTYKNVINTFDVVEISLGQVLLDFGGYWPNVPRSQLRKQGVDTYNVGSFRETVPIKDGVAVVKLEYGDTPCIIGIRFFRDRLKVTQEGDSSACGFGFNVMADGVYVKTSSRAPQIR